jgi:hypothetical protein
VDAHVDDGGGGALSISWDGLDQQLFDLLPCPVRWSTMCGGLKSESFSVKSGVVETMVSMRMPEITLRIS